MNRRTATYAIFVAMIALSYALGTITAPSWRTANGQENTAAAEQPEKSFDLFSFGNNEKADLDQFWDVWGRIEKSYVDEDAVNSQEFVYGAIKGMVESLDDPYTVFMTPEETEEFMTSLEGELNGIGAELTIKNQVLTIVSPIKGSPAESAGVLPEDIIYKINDELAADMTMFEAISKIRGERGTSVHLTLLRQGQDEPIELDIVRDTITIESVSYEIKEDDIAYISISQFNDTTLPEFNKDVAEILVNQPKGLILDLRFNGGGYLDISIDIISEFIAGKKEAVKIKSRNGSTTRSMYVSGNARLADIPLVVLVNKGSASASEIVAGAIQDHKRGLVIGEKTFGKGSVQEVMDDFKDGSSLRLTIAKWYTPNGRSIEEEGIDPDRVIEITPQDLEQETDSQLEEAIRYLKGL